MRKLPLTAAEELLEIIMRHYERASMLVTSNRPVEDWGKCWGMLPPSAPCLIASCTTGTYSNAVLEAGEQKSTCLPSRRQGRTI